MATNNANKKKYFYGVLVLIPVLFIIILELALRIFSYGDDLSLFASSSDSKYLKCNPLVGKRFFSKMDYTIPINDYFLKEKPSGAYRIFVLGESTVQGFPYDANIAFTRILQNRLRDIFPEKRIEVINLGMTAVTSYTLLDFTSEILEQKPDLILIYTGHNEYYGAMGVASMESGSVPSWLKKIHLSLIHLRTYQLLQDAINGISSVINPVSNEEAKMTLMQQMVGKNLIAYNSEKYQEGLEQFKTNMSTLLGNYRDAGVPVIISDQVSNIRDLKPFSSLEFKNLPGADSVYAEAKRLDNAKQYNIAKEKYNRAKDLDAIRFRASGDLNELISELANSYGAHYISLISLFEKNSENSIVGDNLMTEHLHPNVDGYFLMCEGFFNAIKENKYLDKNWDTTKLKPWQYYRNNWGFTALDSSIADLRIQHLKAGWPFKPASTVNNFIFTYKPKNIIDSLAFLTVKYDNVSVESVHNKLASYYKETGDLQLASKEYLSLAYSNPVNTSNFLYAADLAYKGKDYSTAVRILNKLPGADTTIYAQITLATVYYEQKSYKAALETISKLQKLKLDKQNFLISQKLRYKMEKDAGLVEESARTLDNIQKIEPGFNTSSSEKKTLILVPETIRTYIQKADAFRKSGRLSEALQVLLQANKIKETAYTNMYIGKILLAQKNANALEYMEKAYTEIKDDPSLIYNISVLYIVRRDFSKADRMISEFIKIEGENHPKLLQLKDLYRKYKPNSAQSFK